MIQVQAQELITVLQTLSRVVPKPGPQFDGRVEACVRVSCSDGMLLFEAWAPGHLLYARSKVQAEWQDALPAPVEVPLHEFLAAIPSKVDTVHLSPSQDTQRDLRVQQGKRVTVLTGMDPDGFRPEVRFDGKMVARVDADNWHTVRTVVTQSMDSTTTRPVLHGMRIRYADKVLSFGTADGFRLAYLEAGMGRGRKWQSLLPMESITALPVFVDGDVQFSAPRKIRGEVVQSIYCRVRIGGTGLTQDFEYCSAQIDGTYPDIESLIPEDVQGYWLLQTELLREVKATKPVNRVVLLHDGMLVARTNSRGSVTGWVDACKYDGNGKAPEFTAVDLQYLEWAAAAGESGLLRIGISAEGDSRPLKVQREGLTLLVMPMVSHGPESVLDIARAKGNAETTVAV